MTGRKGGGGIGGKGLGFLGKLSFLILLKFCWFVRLGKGVGLGCGTEPDSGSGADSFSGWYPGSGLSISTCSGLDADSGSGLSISTCSGVLTSGAGFGLTGLAFSFRGDGWTVAFFGGGFFATFSRRFRTGFGGFV